MPSGGLCEAPALGLTTSSGAVLSPMEENQDSTEDRMFKRGEEDYEHLLIDLKAMGLGIKILPEEKDQIMFDPGEESKAHGDLDFILRGEEEVSRRVPNTKDRDWDDSTWCGMEWDEAETLFPAPILWEQVGQGTTNVNPCPGTVLGRATASMFSHQTRC